MHYRHSSPRTLLSVPTDGEAGGWDEDGWARRHDDLPQVGWNGKDQGRGWRGGEVGRGGAGQGGADPLKTYETASTSPER